MRATEGFQTTINLSPVNCEDQTLSLELELKMALPMPNQDEHLPDQIETVVHQAGLEAQRQLFQALLEKADQQLVLQRRQGQGGAGIQRRGTRPFTFKTIFGEVTVRRSRIRHNYDDTMEVPSATAWNTSHQLHITGNLRDAVCDRMSDQSAGKTRTDVCQQAGDENLLGRSTIIDIVHQEGKRLTVAQRERARTVLDGAPEAQLALLGPAVVNPDAVPGLVDDDLPCDDSEEAQAEWEQTFAEWIATGFPGCEPALPVDQDQPRAVDEGFVIVEPDEVKTKAQPSNGSQGGVDVHGGGAGGRVALRVRGSHGGGPVVASVGPVAAVGGSQRRASVARLGRRCRLDSSVVREPGDFPPSDDLVLVAPSETML